MISNSPFRGTPLKAVSCDLCGSGKDRTFLSLPDMIQRPSGHVFRLARCTSCDLIYLNPRPYDWDIASYYPASYEPFARKSISARARNWLHRRTVRELAHQLGSPNRVLDVGCGSGELLQQISQAGNAQTIGVEPSQRAAKIGRDTYGLDIRVGTLEQMAFADESFDTVLLSHVLEHLPSPRRTIGEIERILKPGGSVIIWTPNARSLAARFLGRYWMGWDVPRHLYAFTNGSLHRLLETTSLIPGDVLHERHAIEWAWGLRLLAQERLQNQTVNSILATLHPATAAILTPIGILSAALGRSGRIRVIARKPVE